ncbi:hypothetical protein HYC85_020904 [Camellia sinensis]|uniref:Phospholipid/glycerol acyltransferase domain-containing protein n=1 Tax=Camellia sinensis TaxID=4442 RepID=A0A7J7GR43_CAMSI|nr:hypothetical protein HYC85_020904 [Camellia sinensis]
MESELKDLNPKPISQQQQQQQQQQQTDFPNPSTIAPPKTTIPSSSSPPSTSKSWRRNSPAYVRNDVYGTMGRGELPWAEKFLLGIALLTLVPIRVTECNDLSEEPKRPGAIISNHISYLDILYHMSSFFPSFVAKRSVAKLPLVGLISKCLGCVFVQRESKSSDFKGVSAVVNERVREAHQNKFAPMMMLFPGFYFDAVKGTTTNGDFLLPFKTGAFLSKAPVRPVILRYPYQRFSPAWDSISGVRHIMLLLCQFVNYLEVTRLPVYSPSQQEKDDPKLYAENVRRLMAREGNLTMSDIGLAEKRIYHAALNGSNNRLPSVLHRKDD